MFPSRTTSPKFAVLTILTSASSTSLTRPQMVTPKMSLIRPIRSGADIVSPILSSPLTEPSIPIPWKLESTFPFWFSRPLLYSGNTRLSCRPLTRPLMLVSLTCIISLDTSECRPSLFSSAVALSTLFSKYSPFTPFFIAVVSSAPSLTFCRKALKFSQTAPSTTDINKASQTMRFLACPLILGRQFPTACSIINKYSSVSYYRNPTLVPPMLNFVL